MTSFDVIILLIIGCIATAYTVEWLIEHLCGDKPIKRDWRGE